MSLRIHFLKFALLVAFIASATNAFANPSYKDSDWNTTFHASCGLPEPQGNIETVAWVQKGQEKKLRFTLQKGQIGTCSTDNQRRHRAAYWERAELSEQGAISFGKVNTISFEATFLEGFSGERESFFQIHNWAKDCNASPPLMMKVHKGKLQILTLQGTKVDNGLIRASGRHRSAYRKTTKINKLLGKRSNFRVIFDARNAENGRGTLSVFLNDKALVSNARIDFASCAKPYAKFGIYRPGGVSNRSQIMFDKLTLTQH